MTRPISRRKAVCSVILKLKNGSTLSGHFRKKPSKEEVAALKDLGDFITKSVLTAPRRARKGRTKP